MGFLDSLEKFMDDIGVPDPEKTTKKNIESEIQEITDKAKRAAKTIILISDKDEMEKKILETLDEFYSLGARAQIHMKED